MNTRWIAVTALALCACWQGVPAQSVYRCRSSDGAVMFSDLPCRSDIGPPSRVDASPHQGHRLPSAPARSTSRETRTTAAEAAGRAASVRLSRRDRLALEHERRQLLSGLKRRHVKAADRREMIRSLRRVDDELGIGSAEVADMPFHNREVYEEHRIHPGAVGRRGQ